jgi:hypothetical protein
MMALMCLPMAVGMVRGRWRLRHPNTPSMANTPTAATAPLAAPGARQASNAGPSEPIAESRTEGSRVRPSCRP